MTLEGWGSEGGSTGLEGAAGAEGEGGRRGEKEAVFFNPSHIFIGVVMHTLQLGRKKGCR